MKNLLAEFKERRIWRVLIAYPSLTFVWLQVIEFFINNYQLDSRFLTASIVAASVFLPAAILWNWRHGEEGAQNFSGPEVGAYTVSAILAVAAVAWYWSNSPSQPAAPSADIEAVRSIAVLPFENAGDDAEIQHLCDGIAESLTNWLSSVPDLKTISKTAAFRHRDQADDVHALRAALGVEHVVRGKLEKVGDQIIISASLIDTRDESQLWGDRLVEPADEIILLERAIVTAIKQGLRLEVAAPSASVAASGGTENSKAYEHYLRGHFLIQKTDLQSIDAGLDELRSAILTDPDFALPYADIGDALAQMIFYGIYEGEDLLRESRSAAFRAVTLAPDLPEAHAAVAAVHQYITLDWSAADEAYETAVSLAPTRPSPYHRYADYLWATLRHERARAIAKQAIELDPLDGNSMHAVGISAFFDGDFAAAEKALGEWNQFYPDNRWSYVKHAVALSMVGECDESQQQAAAGRKLRAWAPSMLMESWISWAHRNCGRLDLYEESITRMRSALEQNPDTFDDVALFYLYVLENDADGLRGLVQRLVDTRSPLTFVVQLVLLDYMGWPVTAKVMEDSTYMSLLQQLDFPATKWGIN